VIAWRRWARAAAVGGAILGMVILALAPILSTGRWPHAHELGRYGILLGYFRESLLSGIAYPRWLPDLYGGYGYPTFVFYQPGFFYLASAFSALPGSPWSALTAAVFVVLLLGGLGAYSPLGRELSSSARIGAFCAALFLITPYMYVNLHVRGDLSELMAMMLCPWPLYGLARLERQAREGGACAPWAWGIAVSMAMVVVAHPLVAMFLLPAFGLIALAAASGLGGRGRVALLGGAGLAVAAGLALAAPYWLAAVQMRSHANIDAAFGGGFSSVFHVVYPRQLVSPEWRFGSSDLGDADGMSFQLGLPHLVLAALGAYLAGDRRFVRGAFLTYLALVLMMTPFATTLWKTVPVLRTVQFPWRILAVTGTLQIVACAGLARLPGLRTAGRDPLLACMLMASALWYSAQFAEHPVMMDMNVCVDSFRASDQDSLDPMAGANEFLPRTALPAPPTAPRGQAASLVFDGTGRALPLPGNDPYHLRYRVYNQGPTKSTATINQLYLPGWVVRVDGRWVSPETLEAWLRPDGRIRVPIGPGEDWVVEAHYDGPPGWLARDALCLGGALSLAAFSVVEARRRRRLPGLGAARRMGGSGSRVGSMPALVNA